MNFANIISEGKKERGLGNYAQALKLFEEAIKHSPNNSDAFVQRGLTYLEMGDYKCHRLELNQRILGNCEGPIRTSFRMLFLPLGFNKALDTTLVWFHLSFPDHIHVRYIWRQRLEPSKYNDGKRKRE